jgi:hypothetical protein
MMSCTFRIYRWSKQYVEPSCLEMFTRKNAECDQCPHVPPSTDARLPKPRRRRKSLPHLHQPKANPSQSSIAIASTITLLTLTYSRIHADALANDADVPEPRAGKTDERTLQGEGLIPMSEVEKHATKEDCWVVIGGQVWDMTNVRTSPLFKPSSFVFSSVSLLSLLSPSVFSALPP